MTTARETDPARELWASVREPAGKPGILDTWGSESQDRTAGLIGREEERAP